MASKEAERLVMAWAEGPDGPGPRAKWPEALRVLVSLMLHAGRPSLIVWGPQLQLLYNDACAPLLGGLHPRALGRPLRDAWPEGWASLGPCAAQVMAGEGEGEGEYTGDIPLVLKPPGEQAPASWSLATSPIVDDATGAVLGCFVTGVQTVPERPPTPAGEVRPLAMAEAPLQVAERRYGELLDAMGEGFVVLDEGFHVVQINAEGVRIDGRRREDILGRTHWTLWPEANGTPVEAAYRRVMHTGQPEDLTHRYVSGEQDMWLRIRIYPVSGGIASLYRDITEIVRAEQALQHSNERFRAAISAIGVLWTNDADGRMVGEQPGWAQLTGQGRSVYEGYGWTEAVHPDDVAPTVQAWHEAVMSRTTFIFEHRVRRVDGQWRRFSIRAVPIVEADGSVREWVGVHIDITDASAAFEALRQADRKKDEFIATLAHELRNPLAPIRTAAHLLSRPELRLDPARLQWCGELITRQAHVMSVLLDDLLDVARITSGRLELRRSRVPVREVVDNALETVAPLVDTKRHRLAVELDEALPALDADPVRVVQVLSNLLTNAAKYTDPGGHLALRVRADGERIVFEVSDNGIGIAPEALPTLFQMFNQISETLDRTEGGLGIGLALTRGLVQLHGGTITADSAGRGRGSCFTVMLPASADAAAQAAAAGTSGPGQARTPSVLVVDDNVDAAEALAMLLQTQGLVVHVAHSGPEALAAAERHQPQAALLDLGMPGMSGYALAEALRRTDWGRTMALAVISGWGREDDRRRASAAGFDHHFTKPVDPAALLVWLQDRDKPQ